MKRNLVSLLTQEVAGSGPGSCHLALNSLPCWCAWMRHLTSGECSNLVSLPTLYTAPPHCALAIGGFLKPIQDTGTFIQDMVKPDTPTGLYALLLHNGSLLLVEKLVCCVQVWALLMYPSTLTSSLRHFATVSLDFHLRFSQTHFSHGHNKMSMAGKCNHGLFQSFEQMTKRLYRILKSEWIMWNICQLGVIQLNNTEVNSVTDISQFFFSIF